MDTFIRTGRELSRMKGMLRFPQAVKQDPAIDVWLKEQTPEFGAIARTWFMRMRECGSDVRELMHDGCPTACVDDAPFAYVNVFRAHANVGFFHGAELEDPMGLLEGSGKRMRHVKVKPGIDVDSAALDALIDAAYTDIKLRLAVEHSNGSSSRIPLDVLEIEPMASGHRSLRLTRTVAWEEFGGYAESLVRALGGSVLHRVDSPVERVWSVRIGDGQYWLSLDDFGLGIALDSCDASADAQIDAIRSRLREIAGRPG